MKILCEISIGELVDKISILEIKLDKIQDSKKNKIILNELNNLIQSLNTLKLDKEFIDTYKKLLKDVNLKLWNVEDELRELEREKKFTQSFIELARSVYILNDERFEYKNKLNTELNSKVIEVKSYEKYQ